MNSLVLGATGHLGNNLVRMLLRQGDRVRIFIRPTSKLQALIGLDVCSVVGDLNDLESLEKACNGIDILYHCAGYYPVEAIPVRTAVNQALRETHNVLEAVKCSSIKRVVYASSFTTIGVPKDLNAMAAEEHIFSSGYPDNPYLMSKAAMERMIRLEAEKGFPAVVLNPTVFFGPYDSKPSSRNQIIMIAKRLMPGYVDGLVNVIDVRDVAMGMIRAGERGRVGERYILGHWNTSQRSLNRLISKVCDVAGPLVPMPVKLVRYGSKVGEWTFRNIFGSLPPVAGFSIEIMQHMQHYDCTKAIQELDYPRSPVETAIRDAVTWFRDNGYLER